MRRVAIVLFYALSLGCDSQDSTIPSPPAPSSSAPTESAAATGADELSGRWRIVSLLKNGQEALPGGAPIELDFANGRQVMTQGGVRLDDSGYALDPSTMPKSIDTIHNAGGGKTAVTLGIYEVHGDDARLCMGSAQERPMEFTSTHTYNLTVLQRISAP